MAIPKASLAGPGSGRRERASDSGCDETPSEVSGRAFLGRAIPDRRRGEDSGHPFGSIGMRVAFLVTDYPAGSSRFAGIFHRTLAEALVRASARVEVVAPVARVPWPMTRFARKWAEYDRIPTKYCSGGVLVHRPRCWQIPRGNYLALRHRSFARCLNRAVERAPDVIHAHFAYPCGLAAERAASRWRIPVVLTLHGSDVNVLPYVNRVTRRCFVTAVRRATFVSAVSNALADRTEGLTGRRPSVMPIGIDLRRFRELPERDAARRLLGLPGHKRIALFVGALLKAKGVDLLREALKQRDADDVLGVFVGDGPLRAEIQGDPRCLSVGAVDNSKIPLYLRAADVLVLPSRSEGDAHRHRRSRCGGPAGRRDRRRRDS